MHQLNFYLKMAILNAKLSCTHHTCTAVDIHHWQCLPCVQGCPVVHHVALLRRCIHRSVALPRVYLSAGASGMHISSRCSLCSALLQGGCGEVSQDLSRHTLCSILLRLIWLQSLLCRCCSLVRRFACHSRRITASLLGQERYGRVAMLLCSTKRGSLANTPCHACCSCNNGTQVDAAAAIGTAQAGPSSLR